MTPTLHTADSLAALPDRDLDAVIAEVVFGWTWGDVPPDADGENAGKCLTPHGDVPPWKGFELPPKGKLHHAYFCPHWSREWQDAITAGKRAGLQIPLCELQSPRAVAIAAILAVQSMNEQTV
jgi:hypothetical protein